MRERKMKIKDLWLEFLNKKNLCGLCNNTGRLRIDDETRYCICPNGRTIKKQAK